MSILHLANVFFEWELETRSQHELKESFYLHPNFMQLQFLPLLFAHHEDGVAVTHFPPTSYIKYLESLGFKLPAIHLIEDPPTSYDHVESWGWSQIVERWADSKGLMYTPPPFQAVQDIASKAFAFSHSPNLPGAKILHHLDEVEKWLGQGPYPKVLKTCYGYAGRGKFILKHPDFFSKIQADVIKTFNEGHVLIGEPWVKRTADFSTQWELKKDLPPNHLGTTLISNTESGRYTSSSTKDLDQLTPFLEEHLEISKQTLKQILDSNYYGNLGIDAMIYQNPTSKEKKLHPIVEINLRKTMGWLMLQLEKTTPFKTLAYKGKDKKGLLPSFLTLEKNKTMTFTKQLQFA